MKPKQYYFFTKPQHRRQQITIAMSSDEDFSLVIPPTTEETLESIKALINNYKKKYEQLIQDQEELVTCRNDQQEMAEQFRQRSVKLNQKIKEDQRSYEEQMENDKAKIKLGQQEESDLMEQILRVEEALEEEKARNHHLKQQNNVFSAVPERKVAFTGLTGKDRQEFDMETNIVYPMEGGTAFITFEEEVVASTILKMQKHEVKVGRGCRITVEARPVHLMLPRLVEINSEVSSQHILISSLPKMEIEPLLNKLEIHFSKTKHGGGEVEKCEMLPDSWTVALTFLRNDIAKGLIETEHHDVNLQEKTHRVRVTPFLNGTITNLVTKMTACPRTLLLTGIPTIMDRETLQDELEIHFQRSCHGGGEVAAFLYNPLGQHTSAVFGGPPKNTDKETE
ncbi:interferon-induced 35 kDa protein isoform X1 [Pseudochaenichthys georgianus]|uniref:interferon-induced 35 kDa protein isoform X1 n=1 Tax=Pseudochaenichthys georgianus TaxID=52239 RepID=UPI00146DD33E|nr:interferon-induced 35 kDa protein homolog [Pseudochaenichthys georgianus]